MSIPEISKPASTMASARAELARRLFPEPDGIPRLWCPTLTHFAAARKPDAARLRRHLEVLAPHVKGILVPGSTGEGWEMSDDEILELLGVVLEAAAAHHIRVLVGVLKADLDAMLCCLDGTLAFLRQRTGADDPERALAQASVVGFTVCPPKGRDLTQADLEAGLAQVLERGLPAALYQLPQVTENELAPETVAGLAARFPNFYLFKDTSGADRVAQAGVDLGGVFLVRGAEGGYARWTRGGGGPYDGLLLSTANVFADRLYTIFDLLDQGRTTEATGLSARLEAVVQGAFGLVEGFPTGNPFTNANKLLDHVMAHGANAARVSPPLLYTGASLPAEWIPRTVELLKQQELMPDRGYLE